MLGKSFYQQAYHFILSKPFLIQLTSIEVMENKKRDILRIFHLFHFFPIWLLAHSHAITNIPQIKVIAEKGIRPRWRAGIFLFVIGLNQKVLIADRIGNMIDPIIDNMAVMGSLESWFAMFGYGMQIYFDFSGYSDMAIGLGRLMRIELPQNFDSPYKAISPSDFWKRWHITLSKWLKDYLYIPLGGNRCSPQRQKLNLMLTMMLGGLWHGASWNFLVWGIYHGLLLLIYHLYKDKWDKLPKKYAWL
ncbi:MAG: MBOAT family O-acyltransferase [Bdellovibrionota bacterium]